MKPEQAFSAAPDQEFANAGIRLDLIPILQKLGITSVVQMKEMKASKLFNDVCGMRKKLKLENVANPTLQEVEQWLK
jgi:lysyl-tRNA synthetase class 2